MFLLVFVVYSNNVCITKKLTACILQKLLPGYMNIDEKGDLYVRMNECVYILF